MKKQNNNNNNNTGFLDLLFNTLLGFAMLFFLSFHLMNPMQKKADIKTKAEFVITVTWPDNNKSDVDTWTQDPLENVVWYTDKTAGLTHLDRDDLGNVEDEITLLSGEKVIFPHNQELTTIRGFVPGEWILNIHMYKKREDSGAVVEVMIDKLNPTVKRLFYKKFALVKQWQEITVTRFTMARDGEIIEWNDLPKNLVKSKDTTTQHFRGESESFVGP